jgi:exodeoxyribonuclease III
MKIVTWNINSVRLRLGLIKRLIEIHNPDVIALQEIKVIDDLFPSDFFKTLGYKYLYFSGQKSYNGVAIISRIPAENPLSLQFFNDDKRHIGIKIGDIEIHNFYIPAGGDIPDVTQNPKFKHKLEYIGLIHSWLKTNKTKKDNLILLGDFNIAPHEHDVWSSRSLRKIVSHTDIERAALNNLQRSLDFIDSGRHFTPPDQKHYTWWSYRNKDWQKSNRGRRLDHIWVSTNMGALMNKIDTFVEARNWDLPSDHVPYMLNLNIQL